MNIIIHREYSNTVKADSRYLYEQLRVNFPYELVKWEQSGCKIKIRDITILFYSGNVHKMDRLKIDYYNCDTHPACDYCWGRVHPDADYDPELRTFSNVLGIIRKEIEKND